MDDRLRGAWREYLLDKISAQEMGFLFRRAGEAVELFRLSERQKSISIDINLKLGTSDSVLGVWDLDDVLFHFAKTYLIETYAASAYLGTTVLEAALVFDACPELEQLLGELSFNSSFLISYENSRPILILSISLADNTSYLNRRAVCLSRLKAVYRLFGPVECNLWSLGNTIAEGVEVDPSLIELLSQEALDFSGEVNLSTKALQLVKWYGVRPSFLGKNMDWIFERLHAVMKNLTGVGDVDPNVPSQLLRKLPSCYHSPATQFEPCLGIAERHLWVADNEINAGSTEGAGLIEVESPLELVAWIWWVKAPNPIDEYHIYLIQGTRVVLLGTRETIGLAPEGILDRARNEDSSIKDIHWLNSAEDLADF